MTHSVRMGFEMGGMGDVLLVVVVVAVGGVRCGVCVRSIVGRDGGGAQIDWEMVMERMRRRIGESKGSLRIGFSMLEIMTVSLCIGNQFEQKISGQWNRGSRYPCFAWRRKGKKAAERTHSFARVSSIAVYATEILHLSACS